jgi:hypothetical protein
MPRTAMRLIVAVASAIAAASCATPADASTGAIIEPAGAIEAPSSGKVTFGSGPAVACDLTLVGSLVEGPIDVESGEAIGSITEAAFANCEGGSVAGVLNLPWTLRANAALGTPPEAATGLLLTIEGMDLALTVFGGFINCLYGGAEGLLLTLNAGDPYTTGALSLLEAVQLAFVRGSGFCPSEGGLSGTFALTAQEVGMGVPPYWTSPKNVDFGEVATTTTARRDVKLINQTGNTITVGERGLNITGDQVFGGLTEFVVGPQRSVRTWVSFTPPLAQAYSGTIELEEAGSVYWRIGARGRGK